MQVKKQQLEPDVEQWIGSKLGKECVKAVLSPRLFNLHAEHIMQNAGLDESQAGIKIARRNINNLRYADVTVLMAESKEELKSLLMKMKEESASSVQFSLVAQSCLTLCDPMDCSTPGLPIHHQLLEFTHTHVHWVSDAIQHLILCRPLLFLPLIFPNLRVFSNESAFHIRWPKYWNFSFSISLSNEYSGLISFRMDWLDLLAVQGTLKSLLHHQSSKTSILQCSAFFTVQLSYPFMITGKTIALTRQTFVGKVMYLLFNMLYRLVIAFLPRSKHLLISWLQSPSAVILELNLLVY